MLIRVVMLGRFSQPTTEERNKRCAHEYNLIVDQVNVECLVPDTVIHVVIGNCFPNITTAASRKWV